MWRTIKEFVPIEMVGIWQSHNQFQCVWFDWNKQPQFFCLDTSEQQPLKTLVEQLKPSFNNELVQLQFICCLPPHLVWNKNLILPQPLNAQECEQQCRFILQKELPIPLDELWVDYTSYQLKQGFRLDIYATKKEQAICYKEKYRPFKLKVVDIVQASIVRAFEYLIGKKSENTLYLFQNEDFSLALCPRPHQLQMLQSIGTLPDLYQQFQLSFPETIEQIYVYSPMENLPSEWQRIETDLPFIALGNALWNKDVIDLCQHKATSHN